MRRRTGNVAQLVECLPYDAQGLEFSSPVLYQTRHGGACLFSDHLGASGQYHPWLHSEQEDPGLRETPSREQRGWGWVQVGSVGAAGSYSICTGVNACWCLLPCPLSLSSGAPGAALILPSHRLSSFSTLSVPSVRSHSWGTGTMRRRAWPTVRLTTTRYDLGWILQRHRARVGWGLRTSREQSRGCIQTAPCPEEVLERPDGEGPGRSSGSAALSQEDSVPAHAEKHSRCLLRSLGSQGSPLMGVGVLRAHRSSL